MLALSCSPVSDISIPCLRILRTRSPKASVTLNTAGTQGCQLQMYCFHIISPLHSPVGPSFLLPSFYPKHCCCKSHNHPIISPVLTSDPQHPCLQSSQRLSDKLMLYGSNYILSAVPHGNILQRAAALQPPPPCASHSQ